MCVAVPLWDCLLSASAHVCSALKLSCAVEGPNMWLPERRGLQPALEQVSPTVRHMTAKNTDVKFKVW